MIDHRIIQYETRLQSQISSNWCNKDDRISTLQVFLIKHSNLLFSLTACTNTSLQEEWAKKLRGKDVEIENFRKDLDAIIETLQHLHDQYN